MIFFFFFLLHFRANWKMQFGAQRHVACIFNCATLDATLTSFTTTAPNKTNAARKVEIIIKKTKSSAKSCTNRNEIIEFSFPFYVFTSAASCRQRQRRKVAHFTLLSCSPQSQLKQAYLPPPPLSLHYSLPGPHNIHSHFGLFVYKSTQFLAGSKNFLSQLSKSF